jgi:hypothetical protein
MLCRLCQLGGKKSFPSRLPSSEGWGWGPLAFLPSRRGINITFPASSKSSVVASSYVKVYCITLRTLLKKPRYKERCTRRRRAYKGYLERTRYRRLAGKFRLKISKNKKAYHRKHTAPFQSLCGH